MDFVDMLLNRFDGESELKRPTNALVCFTLPETGKTLSRLASDIAMSRSEKSAITLLQFIDDEEELQQTEEMDMYQSRLLAEFIPKGEKSRITMRLFVRESADKLADITRMAEEQHCNLVMLGIAANEADIQLVKKYSMLRSDPTLSETSLLELFQEGKAQTLKYISGVLNRIKVPTGIFIDNGLTVANNIFVPVLNKADVHIFTFVYQLAQKEHVHIMVWDAIGIIQSEPKMQKLFQFVVKRTDGRVQLWDDDKKIEQDFIQSRDLVIIGVHGWSKLISTPLSWCDALPSTLIIKDATI